MKAFQYVTAQSLDSARDWLGPRASYLAGGNDLLARMKEYLAEPDLLVNVKSIPGLADIEPGDGHWTLGAQVTIARIEQDSQIRKLFPALHEAAAEVGSLQIRNVATLGGNLAQHSRCWYYRHRDVVCLKKKGPTCFARLGENKFHSLFTGNPCISTVVSNLSIALAALGAVVLVQQGKQTVRWSIADLYAKAWDNPIAHHSLAHGDLILKVEIPVEPGRSAYGQISEKGAFDWALVSCAAAAVFDDGRVKQARIVLGAVAPVPYQVEAANDLLKGKKIDEPLAARAADRLLAGAEPLEHNGYKIPMARALIQRTLLKLMG